MTVAVDFHCLEGRRGVANAATDCVGGDVDAERWLNLSGNEGGGCFSRLVSRLEGGDERRCDVVQTRLATPRQSPRAVSLGRRTSVRVARGSASPFPPMRPLARSQSRPDY